ncbi:MAG: fimbria major subunit [Prevotella sp.]|nr:fimbria major subunit [Prevotella sp.]
MVRIINTERILRKVTAVIGSMLSCLIILSCSFDEPWDEVSTTSLDDGEVYLPVIVTKGDNPLLLATLDNDNYTSDIHFYFYDANGNYITHGEIDPNATTDWNENDDTNIDVQSTKLVVLTGLTEKSYPKYVVAIVNQPANFTFATKLEDMLTLDSDIGTTNNFVMSSSTYLPTKGAPYPNVLYQFYTEIDPSYFVTADEMSSVTATDALQIPVERLAAKVTVNLTADNTTSIDETTNPVYQVNENPAQYVELLGWKLNAVARDSYMFKNLDETWTSTDPWSDWNSDTAPRCYWAKSYYYGLDDYPTDNTQGNTPLQENSEDPNDWLSQCVKYVSLDDYYDSELHSLYNGDGYCPENTNKAGDGEIIEDGTSTSLTCVLIKARAWEYDSEQEKNVHLERSTGNSEGLMYYSLPIQHSNYQVGTTIQQGEYGVVRNNHYTVKITAVNNLGTPVGDDTNIVIVPEYTKGTSLTGLSALWSNKEETINNGEEFIDVTIPEEQK